MAFPPTFNFSYYQGDRYEFVIRPKTSNGEIFPLSSYTGLFTVATDRGNSTAVVGTGKTTIDSNNGTVTCVIEPSFGKYLSGSSYVYDVEISASALNNASAVYYPYRYTLVTGNINITRDISNTGGG